MTSNSGPGPKSRKPDPREPGAKVGAAKFMRMLAIETVPDPGLDIKVCANETECAALADAYGLVDFAPCRQPLGEAASRKMTAGGAAAFVGPQDPPDPIVNGQIDLGALAAEFLALNLDLYPRKPGVMFEAANAGAEASAIDSPFAVLRQRS
jgi:hypothetical protein